MKFLSNIDAQGNKIINVASPTGVNDAVNKSYVDSNFISNGTITSQDITAWDLAYVHSQSAHAPVVSPYTNKITRFTCSANLTIPTGVDTSWVFTNKANVYGDGSFANIVGNRIQVQESGIYEVVVYSYITFSTNSARYWWKIDSDFRDGGFVTSANGKAVHFATTHTVYKTSGDYIDVYAYQDSGQTLIAGVSVLGYTQVRQIEKF